MTSTSRVLLIGFGNPGRLDDGLGPALAAALELLELPGVTIDSDYQLTVEDATAMQDIDVVLFCDAAVCGSEPFYVAEVTARTREVGFSTHSIDPQGVLALARDLFGAAPKAYVIGIRGYDFNEFGERLSERAQANLQAAQEFLVDVLRRGDLEALEARKEPLPTPEGADAS
jgi:hydrogenase maturation protease